MDSGSTPRFGSYLQTKWASPRRIRFWLLVLVVVYSLLGFFALPWIIQSVAESTAKEDFGRELRIESVQTNPFTLNLRINGLELDDVDNKKLLGWEQLFADLTWSSITNTAWTFETIRLTRPVVQEERFASGGTRFSRLAAEFGTDAEPTPKEPLPDLRINELQVENGILGFADNLQTPGGDKATQVSLALQDLALSVKDFTLQKDQRFPVQAQGQLAGGGKLSLDGELQLLPTFVLDTSASISELALKQADPYLRLFANAQLNSGTLTLNGQIHTDAQQPFAFQGSGGIHSLNITEGTNDESLIGWQSLETTQLELSLKDKQIETDPIIVKGLSGRVVIHENRTTNFGQVVINRPANEEDKSEATPFTIRIERIELSDSGLQFTDNSLPLPFSTRIHSLGGEISTLSSISAEPAEVKLEGEVAEYGLLQVDGAIHAWDPLRETNVHLRFRNLKVPEYSPYTVNFAGRKIAGGTMDLDLDYSIDENQLDGKNQLLLHDLKLGEKVASTGAMDLPLELAIGLLQDSNGVIDLTVPISGNVGNPQFDFSKIIKQAVGNAITSVVTAPFSFLANLLGVDSEELSQIEFGAGRTDLLPPQQQRIANLREALNQRPQLVLEFAGPFSRSFDGPVLQEEKAVQALQQRLEEAGREASEPSLTAEANQDMVETMFRSHYPESGLEVLRDYFTELPDEAGEEAQFDALAYRNYLAKEIIAAQSVSEAELKAIGNARAEAAREALFKPDDETGIAAERVRILPPQQVDSVEGKRIVMEAEVSAD
ncbi:membrane protein [Pseudidiomarina salinarum]|uniref:Membrane protein n=1 Tax=Pseudidiomarina salinarum TaxID=435908 RepID=A0A094IYE9_9GAMM|nr:DUF748 domain-containing protein [Pseudidiomarina salinarum]KFZ30824.1 membrane protein [Pseudidiomarina salinarum]RUO71293.1 DUF748 domain-containing protein [Pseudidiomarina salinarum]